MDIANELKRLEAGAPTQNPGFDYQGLLEREAAGKARARRRLALARGTASALVVAVGLASVWRFTASDEHPQAVEPAILAEGVAQPRMVRADDYLALATLEDHIATIDDALSDARLMAPRGADVERLERTRAELLDSYAQVRYAQMVSANF